MEAGGSGTSQYNDGSAGTGGCDVVVTAVTVGTAVTAGDPAALPAVERPWAALTPEPAPETTPEPTQSATATAHRQLPARRSRRAPERPHDYR